jgi:hypothetical protein
LQRCPFPCGSRGWWIEATALFIIEYSSEIIIAAAVSVIVQWIKQKAKNQWERFLCY